MEASTVTLGNPDLFGMMGVASVSRPLRSVAKAFPSRPRRSPSRALRTFLDDHVKIIPVPVRIPGLGPRSNGGDDQALEALKCWYIGNLTRTRRQLGDQTRAMINQTEREARREFRHCCAGCILPLDHRNCASH